MRVALSSYLTLKVGTCVINLGNRVNLTHSHYTSRLRPISLQRWPFLSFFFALRWANNIWFFTKYLSGYIHPEKGGVVAKKKQNSFVLTLGKRVCKHPWHISMSFSICIAVVVAELITVVKLKVYFKRFAPRRFGEAPLTLTVIVLKYAITN